MKRVLKSATSLVELAGQRVQTLREGMGLTQAEFGERVGVLVGGGWSRQVVWQVEQGKRALSAADLLALAAVCEVPPSDIVGSDEPLSLGGKQLVRTSALLASSTALPEVDGWARFEDAKEALTQVRDAWSRYAHQMEAVRIRVAQSERLRKRIESSGHDAAASLDAELAAINSLDAEHARVLGRPFEPWRPEPTPATVAATDALNPERTVSPHSWLLRPREANESTGSRPLPARERRDR